jgi:hypothetical protein
MEKWNHPWWIFWAALLPQAVLMALYYRIFTLIQHDVAPECVQSWTWYASGLGALYLGQVLYFFFLLFRKKNVHVSYCLVVGLAYIALLFTYSMENRGLIPFEIPRWMVPDEAHFFPWMFLIPNLAYALLGMVVYFTRQESRPAAFYNLLYAFAIPAGMYMLGQVLSPLFSTLEQGYGKHLIVLGMVMLTVLFLFFFGRSMYIFALRNGGSNSWEMLMVKAVIVIVFPLLGLLLNNNGWQGYWVPGNIFGNFSNLLFYWLALANGVMLCLPDRPEVFYRLPLFILRSMGFSYIVYFNLVFLPYLPLAVLVILVFGLGFLMLSPLAVFLIQSRTLIRDVQFLQGVFPRRVIGLAGICGFLTIPVWLTFSHLLDRNTLNKALDYVYQPNLSDAKAKKIAPWRIRRVLDNAETNQKRQDIFDKREGQPLLSFYYNFMVLDNLSLSESKSETLANVFLGEQNQPFDQIREWEEAARDTSFVVLKDLRSHSRYNTQARQWESTLELDIYNPIETMQEFTSHFKLPAGGAVSEYYLYLNGQKVKGELAERKAATWIYRQISMRTSRDPGIVYYLQNGDLALRVFPVQGKELRKTGFTILHPEPAVLTVLGKTVQLGSEQPLENRVGEPLFSRHQSAVYLPLKTMSELPKVELRPEFHFVLDCSVYQDKRTKHVEHVKYRLKDLEEKGIVSRFHLCNWQNQELAEGTDWQKAWTEAPREGGFYAEKAIQEILYQSRQRLRKTYPVIILVSDGETQPILGSQLANWEVLSPFSPNFYEISGDGGLLARPFAEAKSSMKIEGLDLTAKTEALAWPNTQKAQAYLPDGTEGRLVLLKNTPSEKEITQNQLPDALEIQAQHLQSTLNPGGTLGFWQTQLKNSFRTGILSPVTAYMVLETEAQRVLLRRKQAEVLRANQALDLNEEQVRMSEPGFWLLLMMMGLWFWWRRKKVLLGT